MAFMQPQYLGGRWLSITTDTGETYFVPEDLGLDPADCIECGEVAEVEVIIGIGARLSAPGFMDCTDWCVFDTLPEARQYIIDTYEVDAETGDELPEE